MFLKFLNFVLFLYFALALLVVVNSKKHDHKDQTSEHEDDGKIVGGSSTSIQSVPYQAYMIVKIGNDNYQCGGSIISPSYILTAAHCLTGVSQAYVRVGSSKSDSGGTVIYATSLQQHPKYNAKTSDYDVGYLKLQKDIKLDGKNTMAVKLVNQGSKVSPGSQILVSGWGKTSENGATSIQLMAVKVPVVSTPDCRKSYGTNAITDRMFCAGVKQGGKDSCQGDSGGPAVLTKSGQQVGIVSFGNGCARPNYPGVYTNVSDVRAWIKSSTGV